MNTANTMPSPATVTNPPFCDSSAGAPAVVALTAAALVVDVEGEEFATAVVEAFIVEPADETFPLDDAFTVAVEFIALPVALAMDADFIIDEATVFDAFVLEALWAYR